ncbi:MAG TPA: imidazoleglycerol-phosphate dehydratase HisB [Candidatus Dormibacteraeota bacterium]|nr:imidazoleglycerol-phosphate dehydratase HisB [Candidatus Dormibacteraeota bacterium]
MKRTQGNGQRKASLHRTTKETDIRVSVNLDGQGKANISTGIRFFDHMLEQIARHGGLDLQIAARGDLDVDQHHTVEDVGIALGEAVKQALGSKRGILRAGYFLMPMDESLGAAALDFSGRAHFVCKWRPLARRVGDFQTELLEDFFQAFAQGAAANVHLRFVYGRSSHHQVEVLFKSFARALRFAITRDRQLQGVLPSTKGLL